MFAYVAPAGEAVARVNVFGESGESFATLTEAIQRRIALMDAGYAPTSVWVTVRTGATQWTDVMELDTKVVSAIMLPEIESGLASSPLSASATDADVDADEYADHSDPDAMPSAEDVEEMLDWAEEASDYRHSDTYAAYDRLARNAGQLLDRAYEHRSTGYALSAIERATRASELAAQLTEFERAEMRNLIGEAQRFIQRVEISAQYAR
ncbi:hypothetical protein SEA_ENCELADUS_116 [Mycobacterium phage Enceladus]|uniref:Uncharacterized protein n=1 Tax=Mycobacterium phage DirkDirk TaxID=2664225 RepID=A0A5Q2WCW9_9CAUD|nr:hypothetical protein KNU85_gp102 [Mycobacterium phage DirkDirk]QGH75218.1 hypothetical protein SEA_DIRKDIRK_117 [Mycobacterium phage DirkDirk]UEM46392.1 hypothetical protein SEA_ENCELADUS_116 [Mycobacterium phage Enceladus]